MESPERRLEERGIKLPRPPAGVGAYTPWVVTGVHVVTSGQLPWKNGELAYVGQVPTNVSLEDGYQSARLCAINATSQLQEAVGELSRVRRIVRVEGYVHAAPGFDSHPKVLDGASDWFVEIFGEAGVHTRVALGISDMPLRAATQIAVTAEIEI